MINVFVYFQAMAKEELCRNKCCVFPLCSLSDYLLNCTLAFLSFDEISKMRLVSKRFDRLGQRILNIGFQTVERSVKRRFKVILNLLTVMKD